MCHRLASLALRDRAIYAKRDGRPAIVHAKDNHSRLYVAGTVDAEGSFRTAHLTRSAMVALCGEAIVTVARDHLLSAFPVSPIFAN